MYLDIKQILGDHGWYAVDDDDDEIAYFTMR